MTLNEALRYLNENHVEIARQHCDGDELATAIVRASGRRDNAALHRLAGEWKQRKEGTHANQ